MHLEIRVGLLRTAGERSPITTIRRQELLEEAASGRFVLHLPHRSRRPSEVLQPSTCTQCAGSSDRNNRPAKTRMRPPPVMNVGVVRPVQLYLQRIGKLGRVPAGCYKGH